MSYSKLAVHLVFIVLISMLSTACENADEEQIKSNDGNNAPNETYQYKCHTQDGQRNIHVQLFWDPNYIIKCRINHAIGERQADKYTHTKGHET